MGVTALDIKKVCLRCVAVIIVAFVMPTGIWLYAKSASRFGRVAAVAAGVTMGEYKPYFSTDDDSKATAQTAYPSKLEAAVVSKHSIWDMGYGYAATGEANALCKRRSAKSFACSGRDGQDTISCKHGGK